MRTPLWTGIVFLVGTLLAPPTPAIPLQDVPLTPHAEPAQTEPPAEPEATPESSPAHAPAAAPRPAPARDAEDRDPIDPEHLRLTDRRWSLGTEVGVMTLHTTPLFNLEIPIEYTLTVGPGDLALHAGFMLSFGGDRRVVGPNNVASWRSSVWVGLPFGARYKIRVLASHPLYVWPMMDVGPMFETWNGHAVGFVRMGAGLSYLVHPAVEVFLRPLTVGAAFDRNGAWFLYNLTMGANFRF